VLITVAGAVLELFKIVINAPTSLLFTSLVAIFIAKKGNYLTLVIFGKAKFGTGNSLYLIIILN